MIQGPWSDTGAATLSKLQLSIELGKSTKTIERYMDKDLYDPPLPHERSPRGHARFNLATCLEWLDQQQSSEDERTG